MRPSPGAPLLESLPGPGFGPFDSYPLALASMCERMLAQPHSSAGRRPPPTATREEKDTFSTRWRVSTEYCAWMYYTPDERYEVSKLTDQTRPEPTGTSKHCFLPSTVEDRRYPPDSIKYIFVLHTHPFDTPISEDDVLFIVSQGLVHGFEPRTKDGDLRLSMVAFFSNDHANPRCDGFYVYTPQTSQILKWTRDQGRWMCEQTHVVKWREGESLQFDLREAQAPCSIRSTP